MPKQEFNSTNSSNQTSFFLSKEEWLALFGSTKLLDQIILYAQGSLCLVSAFLNVLSFFILNKRVFSTTPLFQYLKVYVINSALLCLALSTTFIGTTYSLFDFTNTYWAREYESHAFMVLYTTPLFYSGVLDVFISLERLFFFMPRLNNKLSLVSYKKVCSALLALVVAVNFPFYFLFTPAYLDVQLGPAEEFRIYYFGPSKFGSSEVGKIVSYVIYFVRDVLTLALELGINIASIVFLRRLIRSKKDMGLKSKQPTTSLELEDSSIVRTSTEADMYSG